MTTTCAPRTLLNLTGPPSDVMPLSMFLTMHGCSTTEIERAGMDSQGACGRLLSRPSCFSFMVEQCWEISGNARAWQLPPQMQGSGNVSSRAKVRSWSSCSDAACLSPLVERARPRPFAASTLFCAATVMLAAGAFDGGVSPTAWAFRYRFG